MKREMVNFDDETGEWIEAQVEEDEFPSKSALIKEFFRRGRELTDELAECRDRNKELQDRISEKEDRITELEQQLTRRSQIEEKIEDLPDKLRGEMTYQERRQRMLDQASLAQRLRWKVTGVPVDETVDESG